MNNPENKIKNKTFFKLNFDILVKNKRSDLNKIAKDIGIKNVSKKNDEFLKKEELVDIILKNTKYQWLSENPKIKKCNKCKIEKSFDEYHKKKDNKDGLHNICKDCRNLYNVIRSKTLNACLLSILNHSRKNSKMRKSKGRVDAGIFDITLYDLEELWKKQDGRCYYSNIPMNYDKKDWKVSLERLNPDKGYIKDNIVLCCLEFNDTSQWSKEKINEMIEILNKDIKDNYVNFEIKNTKRTSPKKTIKYIINNVENYKCNKCNEIKTIDEFNKEISQGCRECVSIRSKNYNKTPVGFIKKMINASVNHTKDRIKKNNTKRDNSFDIDFNYLVKLYNDQKGLCAYSNLPLQFGNYKEKNWICSLERIDSLKGYVKGNVCLICLEFNTFDRTILYKNQEEGSSQWSKEKFKMFLAELKN